MVIRINYLEYIGIYRQNSTVIDSTPNNWQVLQTFLSVHNNSTPFYTIRKYSPFLKFWTFQLLATIRNASAFKGEGRIFWREQKKNGVCLEINETFDTIFLSINSLV